MCFLVRRGSACCCLLRLDVRFVVFAFAFQPHVAFGARSVHWSFLYARVESQLFLYTSIYMYGGVFA